MKQNKIEKEIEKTKKVIKDAVTTAFYDEKLAYLKGLQFGLIEQHKTAQQVIKKISGFIKEYYEIRKGMNK